MYFPVMLSRVQAQYPAVKTLESVHAEAESPGGYLWRGAPDQPVIRRWMLRFEDLTDAEAGALRELYETCGGAWRTFCFADPMSNLLRWSEDAGNAAWGKSAGLVLTKSAGGNGLPAEFEIVNSNAAPGQVWQEVDLAPGAVVCFSCELRGGAATLRAGGAALRATAGTDWLRAYVAGESSGGMQRLEVEVDAGASVWIRRLQAEMQRAPSPYQGTYERGGVYLKARFAEGGLRITTVAPGRNEAEVVLESAGEDVA